MKKITVVLWLLLTATCAHAQTPSPESLQFAGILVDKRWSQIEPLLPSILAGMESQARGNGAPAHVARILAEEFGKAFTKDTMSEITAQIISSSFTIEETKQLIEFFDSPLGQKYLGLNSILMNNVALFLPIARRTCAATVARLEEPDKTSLAKQCSRM